MIGMTTGFWVAEGGILSMSSGLNESDSWFGDMWHSPKTQLEME